ncbi:UNVERIFIED_CONTAM: hypothetical protein K2H54_042991 [Gekko kuhli]
MILRLQLQGKWYVTAEASNSEIHLRQKDKMKILPSELSITEDNKLKIVSTVPKRIGCKKMGMEFEKLENGTYFQTFGCERKLEIVSTDCETYAMVAVKIEKKEKDIKHLWMYTREPKLTSELKEKFLEHGRSMEFLCGQMIFPHEVACQEVTKTVSDACSPEDANSNL